MNSSHGVMDGVLGIGHCSPEARVPAGYKRTEVGVIPEDWEVKRLGSIADIVNGATPNTQIAAYWNGHVPWCIPTDITSTPGKHLLATERRITDEGLESCGASLLPVGTLLLCSRATIGEVKIAATQMCTNQGFKSLICKNGVSNEFLYYLLLTLKSKIVKRSTGSTFLEIGKHEIASIEVMLPPYREQLAIAGALSDVDDLIKSSEALIAKKKTIKQATMQQLLTGKTRLPGFSGEWEMKLVSDFGEIVTGATPRTEIHAFWGGRYPWITPTDITSRRDMVTSERMITKEGLDSIRRLPANSVLITCIASIGKNAILKATGGCNQQINAIIPNGSYSAEFIYYLFEYNTKYLFAKSGTTATSIVSKTVFSKLCFKIPLIDEQLAIATTLSDIDAEIASLEQRLDKTHAIKQGMMQQLLTGRTLLVKSV